MEELAAAVGEKLGESFDELLAPARLGLRDPISRLSFAFTQFLEKAIADPVWARLVVQSVPAPTEFARSVRAHLTTDLSEAWAQGRLTVHDVELAADIVVGIWLQVTRGTLQRRAAPDLIGQALDAVLRALGASPAREWEEGPLRLSTTGLTSSQERTDIRWASMMSATTASI